MQEYFREMKKLGKRETIYREELRMEMNKDVDKQAFWLVIKNNRERLKVTLRWKSIRP